jgi:hypothetical protein
VVNAPDREADLDMRFAYYRRLGARQRATYRRSDEYDAIELEDPRALRPVLAELEVALGAGDRAATQRAATTLCRGLCEQLGVEPVVLRVLARRPADADSELHGLYERSPDETALVRVWMRTAAHVRVVAYRTFVRTILHEMCHHFDFELLELEDSFHTEGFFQRESSLARQLLPPRKHSEASAAAEPAPAAGPPPSEQLSLFDRSR